MKKPLIKWINGKQQLLGELRKLMPEKYNHYYEPFFGSGALFFDVKPKDATIGDRNKELINFYTVVRDAPKELLANVLTHSNTSEYYYTIRNLDRNTVFFNKLSDIVKAGRFIYLNKSCFNGLYRLNKSGHFSVPFAKYDKPIYCIPEDVLESSKLLQNTKIYSGNFDKIKKDIKKGDLIYLDPPYHPLSKTVRPINPADNKFNEKNYNDVKKLCDYIDSIGGYFMVSTTYCKFITDLFKSDKYHLHKVTNVCGAKISLVGRQTVQEVIITNYTN